jgi:hypothetical protein
MFLAGTGVVIAIASTALFWWLLPTGDKINRWATMPILESVLPILVVVGWAMGIAFLLSVFST